MIYTSLLSLGIALGIIPAMIYGKTGGDEQFSNQHKTIRKILKLLHHWQIGAVLGIIGWYFNCPFIHGAGLGMYLDDILFHSFEHYFKRLNGTS